MTRKRVISIEIDKHAEIEEERITKGGRLTNLILSGSMKSVDIGENEGFRNLTAVEQRDFDESLGLAIREVLISIHKNPIQTLNDYLHRKEELMEIVNMEYQKLRVRSYLKRFTPQQNKLDFGSLADKLNIDDEIILDVVKDIKHLTIEDGFINVKPEILEKSKKDYEDKLLLEYEAKRLNIDDVFE
jgi:hypothetical protein